MQDKVTAPLGKVKMGFSDLAEQTEKNNKTMAMGLGCLQVFLEEGHRNNWLESNLIVVLGATAAISLILFVPLYGMLLSAIVRALPQRTATA
mgnify:CR=1 FL=1